KTGKGDTVRVSLLETAIGLLGYHGVGWLETGALPRREGSGVWHLVPYQVFKCNDGEILTGALNEPTWQRLCLAVGRSDLAEDPQLASNTGRVEQRERVIRELASTFATASVAEWTMRLETFSVPLAPLHTIDSSLTHPQTQANNMVVELQAQSGKPVKLLGSA